MVGAMDAIAIDFETANERRDSACAVGLAWIDGGRVVRRETRLIRPPELRFSPGNIRVHGILPADVRGQPNLPEAMAEFCRTFRTGWCSPTMPASIWACFRHRSPPGVRRPRR